MKYPLSLLFAFTLSVATVGLSANLIVAESSMPSSISNQQLSEDEVEALQRTNAYIEQGKLDKAIISLEAIVEQGSNTVAIYNQLGDLYRKAERPPSLAEDSYTKAVQLAKANQDLKLLAGLQVKLAVTKLMLGKKVAAEQLLNDSQALYTSLGETNSSARLAEWRSALKNSANQDDGNGSPIITRGASENRIERVITPGGYDDICLPSDPGCY